MLPSRGGISLVAKYLYFCHLVLVAFLHSWTEVVQARGGGSKRTFGSPKSQNSPNQQTVDCSDQQQPCVNRNEQSDPSWSSAFGATMALIGPLLVLLTFIIMIKFCFYNSYPKGGQFGSKQAAHRQDSNSSTTKKSLDINRSNNHHDKQAASGEHYFVAINCDELANDKMSRATQCRSCSCHWLAAAESDQGKTRMMQTTATCNNAAYK